MLQQVTQMVHLLPHERFDLYKEAVSMLVNMEDNLSDLTSCKNNGSSCQEKATKQECKGKKTQRKCLWKTLILIN